MGVEKTEKALEDALQNYRSGKELFEQQREKTFNECIRSDII